MLGSEGVLTTGTRWKGDALQKILDANCHFMTNCSKETGLKLQSIDAMNRCTQKPKLDEEVNGCKWSFAR